MITGIAQLGFADKANGSEVSVNGRVVGSSLLGQTFTKAKYFHGRPSAAGAAATGSDATDPERRHEDGPERPEGPEPGHQLRIQLGPTNPDLLAAVKERVAAYRKENGLASDAEGAGRRGDRVRLGARPAHLDRERTAAGAARRAGARLPLATVNALIDEHTDGRSLGFLGEPGVNVLELNIALDRLR